MTYHPDCTYQKTSSIPSPPAAWLPSPTRFTCCSTPRCWFARISSGSSSAVETCASITEAERPASSQRRAIAYLSGGGTTFLQHLQSVVRLALGVLASLLLMRIGHAGLAASSWKH